MSALPNFLHVPAVELYFSNRVKSDVYLLGKFCLEIAPTLFVLKVADNLTQSPGMFCSLWR